MLEIVADLPNLSHYPLFSGSGIQESQLLAPDPSLPRARGALHRPYLRRLRFSTRESAATGGTGMTGDHIGLSLRRLEDERFLTGQGRYVDDIAVPGQLHGVVVRSPHGHAVIESIDAAAARTMPGVHGVFTAADLDADGIGTLPCIARVATVAPMVVPPRRALASGRVRHVGDPVVLVVADTAEQARDAAERVDVVYRPLPAVVDAKDALAAQAPLLWDEAPGNLSYRFERGDKPAVDAAFAAAAHIIEIELVNNRLVVAPIEPRAAIGTYDAAGDSFDLLLTGQGVHSLRQQLAAAVFNMPPERITVRAPDVGGGFGVKNFLYPEWVLVLWAARRLGRPVKWVAERGEEFISSAQGRDNLRERAWRSTATAGFLHSMSIRSPISAPICRPTARAVRPTRRPVPWAESMTSRPCLWRCAAS